MQISANAYNAYTNQNVSTDNNIQSELLIEDKPKQSLPNKASVAQSQGNSYTPMVSDAVRTALLNIQETDTENSSKYTMFTDKGNIDVDLDNLFSNDPNSTGFKSIGDLPPLLLPSSENIKAMSSHVSGRFKQMLAEYNIPSAPEKMTHDNQGKMHLPADYPYADELNQALEENPGIARELSTVNALTSHYVAIQERMPFIEEMGNASSQAETDKVIAKYSHLLHDNHSYKSLALMFSQDGDLSITADGEPVKFS